MSQAATLHICLISAQILPNLIPVLSDENVSGVISFSGDGREQKQRSTFETILNKNNIEIIKKVRSKSSYEIDVITTAAETLKAWLQKNEEDKIWKINLTGGTKPMSIAMHNVFKDEDKAELIYQDSQSKRILNLYTPEKTEDNKSVLDLPTYLSAQKFRIQSSSLGDQDYIDHIADRRWVIEKVFMRNAQNIGNILKVLNATGSSVEENQEATLKQSFYKDKLNRGNERPLQALEDANFFTLNRDKGEIIFTDYEAARFLSGGWLEEYAYWCAVDAGIEHIALNVEGYWEDNDTDEPAYNEFDVVLCHHNQLRVIECKASAFHDKGKGQEIVNKIETLGGKAGGLFGSSLLLATARIDTEKNSKHIARRLKTYRTELIEHSDLPNLTGKLIEWKNRCLPKSLKETTK